MSFKTPAGYWANLRHLNPERYEEEALAYRKKHAHTMRKRSKTWKKENREKYNAWQRSAYERAKHTC